MEPDNRIFDVWPLLKIFKIIEFTPISMRMFSSSDIYLSSLLSKTIFWCFCSIKINIAIVYASAELQSQNERLRVFITDWSRTKYNIHFNWTESTYLSTTLHNLSTNIYLCSSILILLRTICCMPFRIALLLVPCVFLSEFSVAASISPVYNAQEIHENHFSIVDCVEQKIF